MAGVLQEAWTALVQSMQSTGMLTSLPDECVSSFLKLASTPEGQLLDSSLQRRLLAIKSEVSHSPGVKDILLPLYVLALLPLLGVCLSVSMPFYREAICSHSAMDQPTRPSWAALKMVAVLQRPEVQQHRRWLLWEGRVRRVGAALPNHCPGVPSSKKGTISPLGSIG